MVRFTLPAPLLVTSLLVVAACGGKAKPEAPAPQAGTANAPSMPGPSAPDAGSEAPATPLGGTTAEAAARARAVLEQKVFFDFDRSDLSGSARATLDAKVEVLRSRDGVRLTIAGHADERGSDEYNLALGARRAGAVKQYLVQRGLGATRFETVSFGEEQPAARGHDETSWSQNRRAEFQVGGLD